MASGGGINIKTEQVLTIGLVAGAGYLLLTGQMPDIVDKIREVLDDIGGRITGGLPFGGGPGGPISGGRCVGTPLKKDTGAGREEFGTGNIPGNPSAYEVTWCGKIHDQSEDLTFKMYGPSHSGSNCCWCVMHVDSRGKMTPGGEGTHPHDNCTKSGGGSAGVAPCYKAVMRPGPIQEGYALIGGSWRKVAEHRGPCGCNKSSSTKTGNTLMVRCDGRLTTQCVSVNSLSGVRGSGGTSALAQEEMIIQNPRIAVA